MWKQVGSENFRIKFVEHEVPVDPADGPAVQVAFNERAAAKRALTGTDAEGARKTGILAGVHQDQEDHDDRKERDCC